MTEDLHSHDYPRVTAIEPLSSLSDEQMRFLDEHEDELRQYFGPRASWDVRLYYEDDGSVTVAPENPDIKPGMSVIAEGATGGWTMFEVPAPPNTRPDGTTASLNWAAALVEDDES